MLTTRICVIKTSQRVIQKYDNFPLQNHDANYIHAFTLPKDRMWNKYSISRITIGPPQSIHSAIPELADRFRAAGLPDRER